MKITGNTRLLGLFGHPVTHSVSPIMHNVAIEALGLDLVYVPFPVAPDDLVKAVGSLRSLGVLGVNLTIPHKVAALPLLDEIRPEARAVGSVNTVLVGEVGLIGYNTDVFGFMEPLRQRGYSPAGKSAVVVGAGGSARAAVYGLLEAGSRVVLMNRTHSRAIELVREFSNLFENRTIRAVSMEESNRVLDEIASADLVVNCSSVGMWPNETEAPAIPYEGFRAGQVVYDLIYRPAETQFLRRAREAGAVTLNGLEMLVFQGAASFEIWTGLKPPVDLMLRSIGEPTL